MKNSGNKKRLLRGGRVLFFLYMACLVYFLFFCEHYGRTTGGAYQYNLVPFREIRRFWVYRRSLGFETVLVNLFGNVGVFIPVGLAVPVLYKRYRNFFGTALLSFTVSLAAELIQLFTRVGIFDVDDLLLNTLGGCIGYAVYAFFRWRLKKRK